MDAESVKRIRDSWAMASARRDALAETFYDRLFELDPNLRPLFVLADMPSQGAKFTAMLGEIVRLLDDAEGLSVALRASGRRHEGYGVCERDYRTVGEALLCALRTELGPSFDEPTRAAWAEAYTRLAAAMQRDRRACGSSH